MHDPESNAPQWPLRFLRWFCPQELCEEIEGDLVQKYQRDRIRIGERQAKYKFIWNAIQFFRPAIILRNKFDMDVIQIPMLRNYFKTAFRFFARHKALSGINLFGLATGMCVSFFALLYVHFEFSYDAFHVQADNIYRLVTDVETSTGTTYQSTAVPVAPAVGSAFPEVKSATRVLLDYMIVQKDHETFSEEHIAYAEPSLFEVFTLPLIGGNPSTALADPFQAVLSESAARKYFGTTDCLGQTLVFDRENPVVVSGIMRDMPYNSHFRTDIFLSLSTLIDRWNPSLQNNWNRFTCYTYLLLDKNSNTGELAERITTLVNQRNGRDGSTTHRLSLEPLKRVYLHGLPRGSRIGSSESGSITNVYIVGLIAVFVLLIASFNFINLTTAFSLHRAKEIGVRKVFGAARTQLTFQFLTDAVALSLIAFVLALVMCLVLLPSFHALTEKVIVGGLPIHVQYFAFMFLGATLIGLLSGIYPAVFLSGYRIAGYLKGNFSTRPKGATLRKSLVVIQFSVAVLLAISALVIYQQLDYMRSASMGFKKSHTIAVDYYFDARISSHSVSIKNELMQVPGVELASLSSSVPGRVNRKLATRIENADHQMQEIFLDAHFADVDFLKQYEIEVVAGREFSALSGTDPTESMMVNEAAVRILGYEDPADVLGKRIVQAGLEGTIIGVVKDFHFHSLRESVQPMTLAMTQGYTTFLTLTLSPEDLSNTLNSLAVKWKELLPDTPFIYFFTDEALAAQYKNEERFGKLSAWLASIAVLVSCLGLLGLSALSAAQRTKEIALRKVLGAPVSGIIGLLTRDFMKLVAVAFGIGAPLAWFTVNQWLEGFAYRVDVSWWVFVLTGLAMALVAFATISFHAARAAVANPVDSLKND